MLHEFLKANREEILGRSRSKITAREASPHTQTELADGLPIFLDQIVNILRADKAERHAAHGSLSASAGLHGVELLRIGLTVGQVVHNYGSICQSVTELADERNVPITADEFQIFNRCLDDAIANAVTEYQGRRDRTIGGAPGTAHLGFLAQELSALTASALLTFDALAKGRVGISGSTGALHGRTLRRMRVLIDRTLAQARLDGGTQKSERVSIARLIEEMEIVGTIEASDRQIQLSVKTGAYDVTVEGDQQILASVMANLLQNAFKFTHASGSIAITTRTDGDRVLIDIEDECGGLRPGEANDLIRTLEQRGGDQTPLGLGLSISLQGVRASGGEIHVRDVPGTGCVFTVDLPKAPLAH